MLAGTKKYFQAIMYPVLLGLLLIGGCNDEQDNNSAPTCQITSIEDGESVEQGHNVTIVVEATDKEGELKEVRFFIDDYLINLDDEPPYRYVWATDNVEKGSHTIKAEAVDKDLASATDAVQINIYSETELIPLTMIALEGGTFEMGCTSEQQDCFDNETPVHTVTVDGFKLSKYEITNQQYADFLNDEDINSDGTHNGTEYIDINADGCQLYYHEDTFRVDDGKENFPVIEVTWQGAQAFCEYHDGRLPTEAEWEFAARGGNQADTTRYAGSDTLSEVGWFANNAGNRTHEVGTKFPNELDLHDMSGNVWEWCSDWYSSEYYSESPQQNPQGPSTGTYRVSRGGIWNGEEIYCRVTYRNYVYPGITNGANGFRLVKD